MQRAILGNNMRNQTGDRNNYKNFDRNNNRNGQFRNNNYQGNDRNQNYRNNPNNRNDNRNNNFRNNNQGGKFGNGRRPLDEKGIDKNIKNIMATEIVEKENQRDYSSKAIDKQKASRQYDENKNVKKANKSRRNNQFDEFDSGKLKDLKQVDRLSNMFGDQEDGMLEYYDLTTARGKRNRKKPKDTEERNKQKIFELKEITIPENITVKDLAAEMKKTTAEVIKKLFREKVVGENFLTLVMNLLRSFLYDKYKTLCPLSH